MKKVLLGSFACLTLGAATIACDVSVSPAMAGPADPWTGFYIGGSVGGGTMTGGGVGNTVVEVVDTAPATAPLAPLAAVIGLSASDGGLNGKGGVAGGQVGYNFQQGNWVFGVEGEGYWSGIKISNMSSRIPNPVTGLTSESFGTTIKNDDDFTIAGRIGWAFDRTLIYGKGGWAWGSIKGSSFVTCCNSNPLTTTANFGGTLDGPMFGVGIEHALTRNWTVKLEYDHISYGNKEVAFNECIPSGVCGQTGTVSFSTTKQIFKVGANYLFNVGP